MPVFNPSTALGFLSELEASLIRAAQRHPVSNKQANSQAHWHAGHTFNPSTQEAETGIYEFEAT